eukprot:1513620-Amphidinium_carterae.1
MSQIVLKREFAALVWLSNTSARLRSLPEVTPMPSVLVSLNPLRLFCNHYRRLAYEDNKGHKRYLSEFVPGTSPSLL